MKLSGLIILQLAFIVQFATPNASARQVEDLALGVALYEYFQQNDFSALSELMVGEELDRLQNQPEFSGQLTTGIMLSYGMDKEAARRLDASFLAQGGANENIARSNYYLAKLLYRKGEYGEAYDALARVDKSLTRELQGEMSFLLNSSFLLAGYAGPAGTLAKAESPYKLPSSKHLAVWGDYNQYNQLVYAMSGAEAGEHSSASLSRLEKLARSLSSSIERLEDSTQGGQFGELLALRDRTLLSVAYLHLQQNNPREAVRHLRQYSADGVEYNEALLAFGWAALQQEDYRRTIASWDQLIDQDTASPATREALLGLGFVLQKLDQKSAAVSAYDEAITRFSEEIAVLQDLLPLLAERELEPFLRALQSQSLNWLDDYQSEDWDKLAQTFLDESKLLDGGTAGYEASLNATSSREYIVLLNRLHKLISEQEFVVLLAQQRDLRWLREKVDVWLQDLSAVENALDNQRQRFETVFDEGQKLALQAEFAQQSRFVEQLREEVVLASASDYRRLMNADELARLEKSQSLPLRYQALKSEHAALIADGVAKQRLRAATLQIAKLDGHEETARLLAGHQLWLVADQQDDRLWSFEKKLRASELSLAQAKESINAIEKLVPEQSTQARGIDAVSQLTQRSLGLISQLEESNRQAVLSLRVMLDESIREQLVSLHAYLAQAKLAKARLLDEQFMLDEPSGQSFAQGDFPQAKAEKN